MHDYKATVEAQTRNLNVDIGFNQIVSMSTKTWQVESQLTSLLREENIVESRPITPPCRNVVRGPVSNGLVVLPPESSNVQFSSEVTMTSQTNKRHGSAERIQRKLQSVERSKSAGGRLVSDRIVDHPNMQESKKLKPVRTELKTSQPSLKIADSAPENISNLISNGENSEKIIEDVNKSLDKLQVNQDLPIELKAEFLSCVMEKNYEKALHLCNEMLDVDPENETCAEFRMVIKEKLCQGEESEDDQSGTDDSEDDSDDDDESDDSDEEDGEESDEEDDDESSDDDDGENESESSSDSDIEIPSGPINLLMGGLPLRPSSAQSDDQSGNT